MTIKFWEYMKCHFKEKKIEIFMSPGGGGSCGQRAKNEINRLQSPTRLDRTRVGFSYLVRKDNEIKHTNVLLIIDWTTRRKSDKINHKRGEGGVTICSLVYFLRARSH